MNYDDLLKLIQMMAIVNPKSDHTNTKGLYYHGGQWIVTSETSYMSYRPQEAIDYGDFNFLPYSKLDYLKALSKEYKGQDTIPDKCIYGHMVAVSAYPPSTAYKESLKGITVNATLSFNLAAMGKIHKALNAGIKNPRKDIITIESRGDRVGLILRNCEGEEALLMPVDRHN